MDASSRTGFLFRPTGELKTVATPEASAGQGAGLILTKSRGSLDISRLKSGEIPGIDGLRAISVLLVMVAHYGFGDLVPGGLGVAIFFFISGFLITTLMLREASETGQISVRNFYVRRFLRLQPELFVYVALSALAGIAYIGVPHLGDFAAAFLYVTNYYQLVVEGEFTEAGVRWPQLWSLAVEEHYYLTYPLLFAACIQRPRRLLTIIAGACAVLLVWRSILIWKGVTSAYTYMATDCRLDSIAYGCLGALILWRFNAALAPLSRYLRWALPLGLSILLVSLAIRSPLFRETVRYSLQGIALVLIFFGLFTQWGRTTTLFLDAWPMRWIGRMSYAAYLWHVELLYAVEHILGRDVGEMGLASKAIFTVAGCAVTFTIAALSHHCIYRRVLAIRRRFGSHATA